MCVNILLILYLFLEDHVPEGTEKRQEGSRREPSHQRHLFRRDFLRFVSIVVVDAVAFVGAIVE